jgi:hypothetical protein
MRNKWLALALVLSVAINIGVFGSVGYRLVRGKPSADCIEESSGSALDRLAAEIGFSSEQTRAFADLRNSFEPRIQSLRDGLMEKRTRLVEAIKPPEASLEGLLPYVEEIEALQAELQKLVVDQMLKEKALLTGEQQKKFLSMISTRLCPAGRHPLERNIINVR